MARLRYPLTYQCKRCGEIYEGLHRSKTHVKEEHGIAWKRTRKELRVVGLHKQLPVSVEPRGLKSTKIEKKHPGNMRKLQKSRLIRIFAYKGYLTIFPILGLKISKKAGVT